MIITAGPLAEEQLTTKGQRGPLWAGPILLISKVEGLPGGVCLRSEGSRRGGRPGRGSQQGRGRRPTPSHLSLSHGLLPLGPLLLPRVSREPLPEQRGVPAAVFAGRAPLSRRTADCAPGTPASHGDQLGCALVTSVMPAGASGSPAHWRDWARGRWCSQAGGPSGPSCSRRPCHPRCGHRPPVLPGPELRLPLVAACSGGPEAGLPVLPTRAAWPRGPESCLRLTSPVGEAMVPQNRAW